MSGGDGTERLPTTCAERKAKRDRRPPLPRRQEAQRRFETLQVENAAPKNPTASSRRPLELLNPFRSLREL